jgi:hypothetical protein
MITAVLDSCIIFGMPLCDTLLRAAEQNLYQVVLSQTILADTITPSIRQELLSQAA